MYYFSVASIVVFVIWIIVPYVGRRQDLVSARTFFLAGAIVYIGLSGINASILPHYYDYGSGVYHKYYVCTILFFVAFYWANTYLKWPVRWANKQFRKWPPMEGLGILLPVLVSLMFMATQIAVRNVHSLAVLSVRTTIIAPALALTFALFVWFRAKANPIAIVGVIGTFAIGAYVAFSFGGSRRPLYAMLVTFPCCAYWWYFRYQSPKKVLALVLLGLLFVPVIDSAYRAARWQGVNTMKKLDKSEGAKVRWSIFKSALTGGDSSLGESTLRIGHNAAENSLCVIHMVTEAKGEFSDFDVQPFHSVFVTLTLWIPREIWEHKPLGLGITLPYDSKVLKKSVKTNWGPGIVGHAYQEGGLIMAIFYGVLAGGCIRWFDELLRKNPSNPYMVAFLASSSVQLIGWIRGDISTMVPMTFLCFAIVIALMTITRMVLGVESPWRQASFGPATAAAQQP